MPVQLLWDRTRHGRHATATVQPVADPWLSSPGAHVTLGGELRVDVGGGLRLSEVHRAPERLEARARLLRQQLVDRGWRGAYTRHRDGPAE